MNLPKSFFESRLSSLLSSPVHIESLQISLRQACLDASNLVIAGPDPSKPFLTIRHLRAKVSISHLLKKELVIHSLALAGVVCHLARGNDGSFNLPSLPESHASSRQWLVSLDEISLTDSQFHYQHLSADQISGQFHHQNNQAAFTLTAPVSSLGKVHLTGQFPSLPNWSRFLHSPLTLSLTFNDKLKARIRSNSLAGRSFSVDINNPL